MIYKMEIKNQREIFHIILYVLHPTLQTHEL